MNLATVVTVVSIVLMVGGGYPDKTTAKKELASFISEDVFRII
jgi:hypothetical protein